MENPQKQDRSLHNPFPHLSIRNLISADQAHFYNRLSDGFFATSRLAEASLRLAQNDKLTIE